MTGASGFTGSNLACGLIRKGYKVHGLVRASKTSAVYGLGIVFHRTDLSDARAAEEAVKGMDVVYHIVAPIASQARPRKSTARSMWKERGIWRKPRSSNGVKRFVHWSTVGRAWAH